MNAITSTRLNEVLWHALGDDIAALLKEPGVTDVLRNQDGRIWVDRTGVGRRPTDIVTSDADTKTALCIIADSVGQEITPAKPILNTVIPGSGERISATIEPVTYSPTYSIRKPPEKVFDLTDFSDDPETIEAVLLAVAERRNILVAGSTGSGKTSLTSALLKQPSVRADRCLVLEDTHEIVIAASDHVRMLTSRYVSMRQLVETSLRMRPDRIILGEIRHEDVATELMRAMNTGHSGCFSTIHANSAHDAIGRIEDLCPTIPQRSIARAIGCIVFVQRTKDGRRISDVLYVNGFLNGEYRIERHGGSTAS